MSSILTNTSSQKTLPEAITTPNIDVSMHQNTTASASTPTIEQNLLDHTYSFVSGDDYLHYDVGTVLARMDYFYDTERIDQNVCYLEFQESLHCDLISSIFNHRHYYDNGENEELEYTSQDDFAVAAWIYLKHWLKLTFGPLGHYLLLGFKSHYHEFITSFLNLVQSECLEYTYHPRVRVNTNARMKTHPRTFIDLLRLIAETDTHFFVSNTSEYCDPVEVHKLCLSLCNELDNRSALDNPLRSLNSIMESYRSIDSNIRSIFRLHVFEVIQSSFAEVIAVLQKHNSPIYLAFQDPSFAHHELVSIAWIHIRALLEIALGKFGNSIADLYESDHPDFMELLSTHFTADFPIVPYYD
jgi:hypothetical protein